MADLHLDAAWDEVKEKLKESDPQLTDEDLVYVPGNAEELLQRLAQKKGRDVEFIRGWVESVSANSGKAS